MEKGAAQIKKEKLELKGKIQRLANKIIQRGNEHSRLVSSMAYNSRKAGRYQILKMWAAGCRRSIMALRKQIQHVEYRLKAM